MTKHEWLLLRLAPLLAYVVVPLVWRWNQIYSDILKVFLGENSAQYAQALALSLSSLAVMGIIAVFIDRRTS